MLPPGLLSNERATPTSTLSKAAGTALSLDLRILTPET